MNHRILFVGSFLSKTRGSKIITEKIAGFLSSRYKIKMTSTKSNQVFRILDMMLTLISGNYRIVHIDVFSGKALIYADIMGYIAKLKKIPIIMTLHGGMLIETYKNKPDYLMSILLRADIIQTPSLYLQNNLADTGIDIKYMPHFIDQTLFSNERDNVKSFSILWVRAFDKIYNPDLAIKALFEIKKDYPDARLTMIGPDLGEQNQAKALVKSLDLTESVDFIGIIPNTELTTYYQKHAVYLNTTSYESFGVSVLEAASCGIPIVSTSVGEIPYIWTDDEDILLINDFDPNSMARQVGRIFQDQKLKTKLSSNAKDKSTIFSWEKLEPQWIERFDSFLE